MLVLSFFQFFFFFFFFFFSRDVSSRSLFCSLFASFLSKNVCLYSSIQSSLLFFCSSFFFLLLPSSGMHPVQIVALVLYCVLSVVAYSLFTVYDWQVALSGAVSWASLGGSTARVALACIHVCFVAGSAVHCAVGTRFNWVPFVIGVCFNISLALQATFVYSALPLPTIIISSLAAVAGIIGIVVCCLSNRHATEKVRERCGSLFSKNVSFSRNLFTQFPCPSLILHSLCLRSWALRL
jgi:hypothetical protein